MVVRRKWIWVGWLVTAMLLGDFAIGRTVGNSALSISPNGAVIMDSTQLNQDSLENSGNKGSTLQDTVIIEDTVKVLDGRKTLDSRPKYSSRWRNFCDSLGQGWVALSAMILPGSGQILNRDYWKIPLFYATGAGFGYLSWRYHSEYRRLGMLERGRTLQQQVEWQSERKHAQQLRNTFFVATAATYALSVADALIVHSHGVQSPLAAMVCSGLLPGLGQVYNGSYWKIPIIYGAGFYLVSNIVRYNVLYERYQTALVALLDDDPSTTDEWQGKRSQRDLEYRVDYYRRERDFNAILLALLYAMNVIDAYVDAHLFYWNVDSNLALRMSPEVRPLQGQRDLALSMRFELQF